MKKKKLAILSLVLMMTFTLSSLAACGDKDSSTEIKKPPMVASSNIDKEGGGAVAAGDAGDNPNSRYYVINDFYNMKSDDNLTIIEKYKPTLQSSEWSCGVSAASAVLYNFGFEKYKEQQCATWAGSNDQTGTSLDGMIKLFKNVPEVEIVESAPYGKGAADKPPTFSAMSLYTSENKDDSEKFVDDAKDSYFVKWLKSYLDRGVPILVDWTDWGGHWQAIIGYDDNGTETIADDVLIFADPYDTTDHWQDGYYVYPLERWFYQWKEGFEPYQEQMYVIVEPTKEKEK